MQCTLLGRSIGSLGENNGEDHVSDVFIHGAKLMGTTHGVRIKTGQASKPSLGHSGTPPLELVRPPQKGLVLLRWP